MKMVDILFLENKKWYYYDEDELKYKLTKEGENTPEVKKSYEDFYNALNDNID